MEESGPVVGYTVTLPVSAEGMRANVAYALSLGLPELSQEPRRAMRLNIAATGPSFHDLPVGTAPVLALNGALGLLTKHHGEPPAYWAAADPQALVADFLTEAPWQTTYLVASQCDPAVFDRLLGEGAKVLLWHMGEPAYADLLGDRTVIPCMGAITPMALFGLGPMLGYAGFDTWGWDGCFHGGRHHATDQEQANEIVEMVIGDVRFFTTKTWMFELECAVTGFHVSPLDVRIHGSGMHGAAFTALGLLEPNKEAA